MSAVSILSASHCSGDDVATLVARRLDCPLVDTLQLIRLAAEQQHLAPDKLERLVSGTTTFLDSLGDDQLRGMAAMRWALHRVLEDGPVVLHGLTGLLLPRRLTHILRVGLAGGTAHRLEQAIQLGLTEKAARERLKKDDIALADWSEQVRHCSPWDESLHDVLIPMDATDPEAAAELILENLAKPALARTAAVEQAMVDYDLATRVNMALAEKGYDVVVSSLEGRLTVTINKYVLRLKRLEKELVELAGAFPGVNDVETRLGHNFMKEQPKIYPNIDADLPSRVLLVDDEKEFVQTLSERLQTRDLDTAVAYDGEQALAILRDHAPSVMVLDLKMPGLDGLEVLRRVKKSHPEVEVIILSGHGSDAEQSLAMELGAFAYLQKPADIDVLASTMKSAGKKAREAAGTEQADDPST